MSKKALVVDDEKEIADLLEIHLMSQDYAVTKANTGVECLKLLNDNKYDLMFLLSSLRFPIHPSLAS